jgi:hypothetical protein
MRSASAKSILKSNGFIQVHNGGGWSTTEQIIMNVQHLVSDWHFASSSRNIYRNTSLSNAEYSFGTFSRFYYKVLTNLDAVQPIIVQYQERKKIMMWKMRNEIT